MTFPHPRLVFAKRDIEGPAQAILNAPVPPCGLAQWAASAGNELM
jgi:hypothetical protein